MDDKAGMRKKMRDFGPAARIHIVESGDPEADLRPADQPEDKARVKERQKPPVRLVKPAPKAPPPEIADHVSRRLKAVYDDVLNQPIPDRFLELLKDLDSGSEK